MFKTNFLSALLATLLLVPSFTFADSSEPPVAPILSDLANTQACVTYSQAMIKWLNENTPKNKNDFFNAAWFGWFSATQSKSASSKDCHTGTCISYWYMDANTQPMRGVATGCFAAQHANDQARAALLTHLTKVYTDVIQHINISRKYPAEVGFYGPSETCFLNKQTMQYDNCNLYIQG